MGQLTLTELQNHVRFDLDNRRDLQEYQLNRWINWALHHVTQPRVFRHRELETSRTVTLVAAQVTYTIGGALDDAGNQITSVLRYISHVNYVDSADETDLTARRERLEPSARRYLDMRGVWPEGQPARYALWGGDSITFDKRPTANEAGKKVVVYGTMEPLFLTETTDTTTLSWAFDEIIIRAAVWRGWMSMNRRDQADLAKDDLIDMLREVQDPNTADAKDWDSYFEPVIEDHQRIF